MHAITDGKNLAPTDEDSFLLHRGYAEQVPGEDCLRLNIWTPEINGSHARPVMVYMHGGGFSGGCSQDLLSYEGESLARNHDAVVVNHNHRLNIFGFLNLAHIGGDKYVNSANVGLLDIVAVLEWVREHITRFGGDPGNVTIFGQSGGGGKVIALMGMPSAKGLFHRAIVQSGPYLKMIEPSYSNQLSEAVLSVLGLEKGQVDELHKISVDRLSDAATDAMAKISPRTTGASPRRTIGVSGWGPTVDGKVLPAHPFDPGAPSISANIPLLTGTNLHEGTSGLDRPGADLMTESEMQGRLAESIGDRSREVIEAYRREYPKENPFRLYATIMAANFRRPSVEQAARKAALGAAPAYSYLYSWRTPMLDDRTGSFHAAEISFVFDNAELCDHYSGRTPEALALSKQISRAWVSFARTGNPNHSGLPKWPAYTLDKRATMVFDTPCKVRNAPEQEGLKLLFES
jgi:para-nitrobenzyl esterase